MNFRKGDYYIPLNQAANRFLIESIGATGRGQLFCLEFL